MQPEPRILSRRQHHAQHRPDAPDEPLEPRQRVGRIQLVQIVDDQHDGLRHRFKVGQQPLDHRVAVERGRRGDPLDSPVLADRGHQLVDQRQPEPLAIPLTAPHGHPGHPIAQAFGLDPGPQQYGLAASGRRADEDDLTRRHSRQHAEEPSTRNQTGPGAIARRRYELRVGQI